MAWMSHDKHDNTCNPAFRNGCDSKNLHSNRKIRKDSPGTKFAEFEGNMGRTQKRHHIEHTPLRYTWYKHPQQCISKWKRSCFINFVCFVRFVFSFSLQVTVITTYSLTCLVTYFSHSCHHQFYCMVHTRKYTEWISAWNAISFEIRCKNSSETRTKTTTKRVHGIRCSKMEIH